MIYDREPFILIKKGKPVAAIVTLEDIQILQEFEDQTDIADAIRSLEEPGENISSEQMRKELGLKVPDVIIQMASDE